MGGGEWVCGWMVDGWMGGWMSEWVGGCRNEMMVLVQFDLAKTLGYQSIWIGWYCLLRYHSKSNK